MRTAGLCSALWKGGSQSCASGFWLTSARLRQQSSGRRYLYSSTALRQAARPSSVIIGAHVKEALANGSPIVALESTVITHGLPEPQNLELALQLENIVAGLRPMQANDSRWARAESECPSGATAATIGIVRGQLVIGLSRDQLHYLSDTNLSNPIKASRRDIGPAMALKLSAGTTVAATMAIACSLQADTHRCSPIKVFATGGSGGVHRGGSQSMDISADLFEFSRSPICVISSGFKSFLDTRLSLEYLETIGCTVMSLPAQWLPLESRQLFPGFYSAANRHKIKSPRLVSNIEEASKIMFHCLELNPLNDKRAVLLANPIPEEFSVEGQLADKLDLEMARICHQVEGSQDLEGKQRTPMILERLNRSLEGETLKANMELLKNNAKVGAQVALNYAKLANRTGKLSRRDSS